MLPHFYFLLLASLKTVLSLWGSAYLEFLLPVPNITSLKSFKTPVHFFRLENFTHFTVHSPLHSFCSSSYVERWAPFLRIVSKSSAWQNSINDLSNSINKCLIRLFSLNMNALYTLVSFPNNRSFCQPNTLFYNQIYMKQTFWELRIL